MMAPRMTTVKWDELDYFSQDLVVAAYNAQHMGAFPRGVDRATDDRMGALCRFDVDIHHACLHDGDGTGPDAIWDACADIVDVAFPPGRRLRLQGADGPSGGSGAQREAVLPVDVEITIEIGLEGGR